MGRSNPGKFWLRYFNAIEKQPSRLCLFTPEQKVQMLETLMQWSREEDTRKPPKTDVPYE